MRGRRRVLRGMIGAMGLFAAVALLVGGAGSVGAAQDIDSVTVEMEEYDGSGISGTAVLTDSPDGVIVEMTLEGNLVGDHPAHFHEGDCDTMDPLVPIYPLEDVDEDGISVTTVPDITLAEVTSEPFVINVHESVAALPVIISCGNVPVLDKTASTGDDDSDDAADGVGGGSPDAASSPAAVPQAGVGSALAAGGANTAVVLLLGALAAMLAVAGLAVRRAENRSDLA